VSDPEAVLFSVSWDLDLQQAVEAALGPDAAAEWGGLEAAFADPGDPPAVVVLDARAARPVDVRLARCAGVPASALLLVLPDPSPAELDVCLRLPVPVELVAAAEARPIAAAVGRLLALRREHVDRLYAAREALGLCRPDRCSRLRASTRRLRGESARLRTVQEELRRHQDDSETVRALPERLERTVPFEELLGDSPAVKALVSQLDRAAASEASVLVVGETGTGKELVARALHRRSRRAGGPFVALNCAALPEGLLESELFGHVKGAFTGADADRRGLLQRARGGTFFLDEIGDMPPLLQAKLLRVLQERRVRPVGGEREVEVDIRLVAATHFDLERAVREGTFRQDLLYRLNVVGVEVPPLRKRGDDALLLAQHFLRVFAAESGKPVTGIAPAAGRLLLAYDWPGNVRQLENCIERAVAMTAHTEIQPEDLPAKVRDHRDGSRVLNLAAYEDQLVPLQDMERAYVLRVLELVGGNKSQAALALGISRKTLYRKLDSYVEDAAKHRLPRPGELGATDS